jgi:hypothetical protein
MPVINTTSSNLKNYRAKKISEIKNLVMDSITEVEILATRQAPDFVSIDKSFSDGGLAGEVGVMGDNPIAAYFEFGTGLSAVEILAGYPDWVRSIALDFYVNGKGTLQGKPYLFNNFLVIEEKFKGELNKIVNGQEHDS